MTSTYPSVVATLTNPNPTDRLNAPSHSSIEGNQNSEIVALETFVGTLSSAVGTIVYDVRSANSNGGGHVQTANKGGTGQTAYAKGDVLVASSSSVLSKLSSTGNPDGYALVLDSTQATGLKWGVPNSKPNIRIFSVAAVSSVTSSIFTWVKPSIFSYARITVVGAGNGGTSVLGNNQAKPGGTAGGYAVKTLSSSVLGATEEIRVGGAGRISSTAGGLSSFGLTNVNASILCSQTASGGDINIDGQRGGSNFLITAGGVGGDGGSNPLGFGGRGAISSGSAQPPTGFGSGGPGAAADGSGTTAGTFQGMAGVVIVEEY